MAQTIKIRASYAETVSRDYQSNRYGLDLECDVQLNGGDHKQEIETAASTLFNFAKAVVAKQKESGFAVGDLLKTNALPPQPEAKVAPEAAKPAEGNNDSTKSNTSASDKQIKAIFGIAKSLGKNNQAIRQMAADRFNNKRIEDLSKSEASSLIQDLKSAA